MKDERRRMKDERRRMKDGRVPFTHFILHPSSFILSLVILFFSFQFQSCTADPEPTLNYKDRELVDSLFRMQIDTLKPVLDSLCEMRFDSAVQFKADSMMKVRQAEIEKYLERIKREG